MEDSHFLSPEAFTYHTPVFETGSARECPMVNHIYQQQFQNQADPSCDKRNKTEVNRINNNSPNS